VPTKHNALIDTEKFYVLAHIFISAFGAILLIAIWYNIQNTFKSKLDSDSYKNRIDKGLFYVSLSIFTWVISGLYFYFFHHQYTHIAEVFFSTVNNVLLLSALYYFDESPQFIYRNDTNLRYVIVGVLLTSALSILSFTFMDTFIVLGFQLKNIPDLILSGFISVLLILTFHKTFTSRNLNLIAWLSSLIVVLMFFSQLPDVFPHIDWSFESKMLKIISKSSLISIFLVLATSWVIQLASTPKSDELKLIFQDWSLIQVHVPSKGIIHQTIDFKSKTTQFKNLLKFALRRKFAAYENQYIEIGNGKELDSQTYLTRVIDNINSIAQLDNEKKLYRKDLFTFIGQGKYRLRVLPENIEIYPTLMTEFTQHTDNKNYKDFISE
jgi:hypothetical protein